MKYYPMIFQAWKIPKIMDGSATMTRRLYGLDKVNEGPDQWSPRGFVGIGELRIVFKNKESDEVVQIKCPYGVPGDRLWVRETWQEIATDPLSECYVEIVYKADCKPNQYEIRKWRSSIHMPRWASRIDLEITNIRVERVQDITEEDAQKEGSGWKCGHPDYLNGIHWARGNFREIWDSINGKDAWDRNDWIWVIVFRKI